MQFPPTASTRLAKSRLPLPKAHHDGLRSKRRDVQITSEENGRPFALEVW
jgi:hypothetical protein